MAIDTEAKRKSTVNVGLHFLRMGIVPDNNDLAEAERLHVQGLYSGIAADAPSDAGEDTTANYSHQRWRRRRS